MSGSKEAWWIRTALALQSALLWLAPASYRQRFAVELRQVLRDSLRDLARRPTRERQVELARLGWQGLRASATLQHDALSRWPLRLRMLLLTLVLLAGTLLGMGREAMTQQLGEIARAVGHGALVARLVLPADQWLTAQRDQADQLLATGDAGDAALAGLVLRQASPLNTWALSYSDGPATRLANATLRDRADDALDAMHLDSERLFLTAAGTRNEQALWLAYLYCTGSCDRSAIIARWLDAAPDNGYARMLALLQLDSSAPPEQVEGHLQRIIDAPAYVSPHGATYRRLGAAAGQVEPGWALSTIGFPGGLGIQEALVAFPTFALPLPPLQRLRTHCSPALAAQDARRFALCDAVLSRIARDSSEPLEVLAPLRLRAELHGLGTAAHQTYRDATYILQSGPFGDVDSLRAIIAGTPYLAWRRAQREAAGLPTRAPADFRDPLQR